MVSSLLTSVNSLKGTPSSGFHWMGGGSLLLLPGSPLWLRSGNPLEIALPASSPVIMWILLMGMEQILQRLSPEHPRSGWWTTPSCAFLLWTMGNFQLSSLFFFFFSSLYCVACRILVPQSEIKPRLPAVKAQHLNHWTKEVLNSCPTSLVEPPVGQMQGFVMWVWSVS